MPSFNSIRMAMYGNNNVKSVISKTLKGPPLVEENGEAR